MLRTSSRIHLVQHFVATLAVAAAFMAGASAHARIITFEEPGLPVPGSPTAFEVGGLRFSGTQILDMSSQDMLYRALPSPVHGIGIGAVSSTWSYIVTIERVGGGAFNLSRRSRNQTGNTITREPMVR